MSSNTELSFDNTGICLSIQKRQRTQISKFSFFLQWEYRFFGKMGTRITPWAIKSGLPIKGLIKEPFSSNLPEGRH